MNYKYIKLFKINHNYLNYKIDYLLKMSNKKYEIDEINKYKNYTFGMYNKIDN